MGAGGSVPPLRTEIVHESERTRVTRLFFADQTVIRKEPLGPDAERRVEHETALLARLRGLAGVAQLAEAPRYPGSIVLADVRGTNLTGLARPLKADDLIGLALRLARTVAGMHRREVIHRDITPANIVLAADGVPYLVDFALATSFAEIRPGFAHYSEIAGTLAYLAPEQTGRTGRPADQRADLYGLGATLYELATGEPPFGTGPVSQILHDHLTRVPVPPAAAVPGVPEPLSAIIMHLLEKEPDNRYQSADGLAYDLERLRDTRADPRVAAPQAGEHDVPVRLLPPSRPTGRDAEVAELREAFSQSLGGQCAGVLISGAPGVGKTALAGELRPAVTDSGGWFVTGKFDQYRRDLEFDATHQALRALGRLLLAEPEDELALVRDRILTAAGPNAGLLAAVIPEFAALLAVPPAPGDPLTARPRAQLASARALRAIASGQRPVVVFIDDLQWAGAAPLGFVDLILAEEPTAGLLLITAYRDGDVAGVHPLAAPLARWRDQATVWHLRLADLSHASLVTMIGEMLHASPARAEVLADAIEPRTRGNPFETVELLNALRRDGVLTATAAGWRWQPEAVRARLDGSAAATVEGARVAAMPEQARALAETMACLGGRAELSVLRIAAGLTADGLAHALAPAIEDGLLVMEPGAGEAVRFRHDRLREAAVGGIEPERRRTLQLTMAGRLAAVPELFSAAAELYLPVADAVRDPAERRTAAGLLARAAGQATMIGDNPLVERLLSAALALTEPGETAMIIDLRTRRHAARSVLGRLEEADQDYAVIDALTSSVFDRPEVTSLQMGSLSIRNRFAEANDLGIASLRECGITVPSADGLAAEVSRRLDHLYQWLNRTDAADDAALPEVTDPALVTAGLLLSGLQGSTYFGDDPAAFLWGSLQGLRIWTEHGPAASLVLSAANAAYSAIALRGDYAAAYQVAQRVMVLSEARGYKPETSYAQSVFSNLRTWFEPIENSIPATVGPGEGLLSDGDLVYTSFMYQRAVTGLLECAPTVDAWLTQANAGLNFARRTDTEQFNQWLHSYRWLADVLSRAGAAGEAAPADTSASNPLVLLHVYLTRAIAAAIFGDQASLAKYSAAAQPLLPVTTGNAFGAMARPLRGLSLAWEARAADGADRAALLAELDDVTRWLAARAADAPDNFLHLLRLVEAERAWTDGDFRAAALAFDSARREVAGRQRPWHRALITERAARFHLAHGLEQAGYELLAEARQHYLAWGATAKAAQLDWAYPALRPPADAGGPADAPQDRVLSTAGAVDLLGILSASQALSSETSLERLHTRVTEVLAAMTGATGVHLLLWDEERQEWLPAPGSNSSDAVSADGNADGDQAMPVSVLRYLSRTREPLIVNDAVADDRFARDPYLGGAGCCSLLAMPILGQGALQGVLLLENRLIRGAFTAARLDAVELIAGQLTVSLRNTRLYAEYRRVADEQAALRRVATLVARSARPQEVFTAVAEETGRLLDADNSVLVRYDEPSRTLVIAGAYLRSGAAPPTPIGGHLPLGGYNVTTLVYETGRPSRIDYEHDSVSGHTGHVAASVWGFRSSVGVPVIIAGRPWGSLVVAQGRQELLPADAEARLAAFAELVATAIANAEASAEVAASRARVVAAADQARQRIERDLHDGAQQRLVSLALQFRQAQAAVPPGFPALSAQFEHAVTAVTSTLDEVREIARGVHPAALTRGGLRPAVRALARRAPLPVDFESFPDGRLPEHVEVTAYYVIAEALTNATKHARASAVTIQAEVTDETLTVTVTDDGIGGADLARGTGLVGLKDRVEAFGGRMRIESPQRAGTVLRVELPFAPNGDAASW
jgi:signal transduction histidine kinase